MNEKYEATATNGRINAARSVEENETIHAIEEKPTKYTNYNDLNEIYFQSLIHLFKGNIGPGLFAMGFAFKNGGIAASAALTILIAIICVHCQHILVNCSIKMRSITRASKCPDFAETVEQCFENSPTKLRSWSKAMKTAVNVFICVTQLGFCCIYFVFISTNMKQILVAHNYQLDVHIVMLISFIPIWFTSLITNLKYLTPVSGFAGMCMICGLVVTLVYALKDGIPDFSERHLYTSPRELALYFGTAIFAFEGIALVLPLKNSMAKPDSFDRPLGVLNVGMIIVSACFMLAGFVGYAKWGDKVAGSLTLNLGDTLGAQIVKVMVSLGVLFGYPLQFHIAIQIMLPHIIHFFRLYNHQLLANLVFRTLMVLLTLSIAELVPALGLFISLIGSLCSTALALVFPPVIDLLVKHDNQKCSSIFKFSKNIFILVLAMIGFAVGTFESLYGIVKHFGEEEQV